MAYLKIITVLAAATIVTCEPPVQGYHYRQPAGFSRNPYVQPTTDYSPPPNYLPPTSFGNSGGGYGGAQDHGYNYDDHSHGHDHEVPKSYEFGYSVKDAQSGNDYDRHETSDGNVVRGEYRVQLPDGRTQIGKSWIFESLVGGLYPAVGVYWLTTMILTTYVFFIFTVTYHADWKTGFHADVRYEGEARYPEPQRHHQQGGYNYNTPDYSGSLSGFQGNANSYKPSTAYGPPGYH